MRFNSTRADQQKSTAELFEGQYLFLAHKYGTATWSRDPSAVRSLIDWPSCDRIFTRFRLCLMDDSVQASFRFGPRPWSRYAEESQSRGRQNMREHTVVKWCAPNHVLYDATWGCVTYFFNHMLSIRTSAYYFVQCCNTNIVYSLLWTILRMQPFNAQAHANYQYLKKKMKLQRTKCDTFYSSSLPISTIKFIFSPTISGLKLELWSKFIFRWIRGSLWYNWPPPPPLERKNERFIHKLEI